jgi:hypothetical protein
VYITVKIHLLEQETLVLLWWEYRYFDKIAGERKAAKVLETLY